jgi:pimeloyl-ACP methyl ester carboxylesterase
MEATMYPLLLLPGLMNDAGVWKPLLSEMENERICVIHPTYHEEGVAAIASSAIKAMPHGPFCVAGFSLGGYVALEVFRQARSRVEGLALLSTGACADNESARRYRQGTIDAVQSGSSFESTALSFLPRLMHRAHAENPAILAVLTDMARAVGKDGFIRQQITAIHRPDSLDTLRSLNVPSLVLCGADDQVSPPVFSKEAAHSISGATLVVIPDCGHMVTLEKPEKTISAIRQWLQRCEDARSM